MADNAVIGGDMGGFGDVITQFASDVIKQDQAQLKKDVRKAAKVTEQQLHSTSPRRTGRYAAGWTTSVTEDADGHIKASVHNATDWQLTHLLEKGHEQFFMGHDMGHRYPGVKHIEPAYEAGADYLKGAVS